tara:strand:+ start:713 stop:1222 length:510 start_codon:yes stop_codon:yes gene_type:complete
MKVLLLSLIPAFLFSQNQVTIYGPTIGRQVIASAGGVMNSNNIQISYTVGESFISYWHSGNTILTEGFQQGEIVKYYNSIDEKGTEVTIVAYPNPTTGTIRLAFDNEDLLEYRVGIFDMNGRLLMMDRCIGESIDIDMRKYPSGQYKVFFYRESNDGIDQKIISIQKMD